VRGDTGVESDLTTGTTVKVELEVVAARDELLEGDDLRLNFANLLCNDALGKFLDDGKALLNNFDLHAVADNLLGLLNDGLLVVETRKVVAPIEVIKVAQ